MDSKAILWAPWRMRYVTGEKAEGCFLCQKHRSPQDKENYVVYRGRGCYVILNLFPYNPGHLMVAPYAHIPSIEDLDQETVSEMMALLQHCLRVLRKVMNPGGFNMGINIGQVAGAGLADHVHAHIVPRWEGDTNFMPVVADTKVLPEELQSTYEKLRSAWK